MAEKRRSRRAYRRAVSVLSLAGTTTAVWAVAWAGDGRDGRVDDVEPSEVEVAGVRVGGPEPLALPAAVAQARSDSASVPLEASPPSTSPATTPTTGLAPTTGLGPTTNVASTPLTGERPSATVPTAAPTSPQAVGEAALARITYPWRDVLAGWSIVFLDGRSGLLGGTWTYERRIEVYVRPDHTVDEVAFTLAHEMGHAVDVTLLTEADRNRWRAARGLGHDIPWWVESGATDFSSCSGDFAEAFAVWQVGGWGHSRLAGQPTPDQLALLAELAR